MSGPEGSRPARFWTVLAHLVIRGADAPFILSDLVESFARDVARGLGRRTATRRYVVNLVGSAWSVGIEGVRRRVSQGITLDAKLGLRMLVKQPMLTGVAVLALGLGIPASLGFSHVLDVVLSPLPVPEGERVMGIRHWDLESRDPTMASVHDFEFWRATLTSFESIAAVRSYSVNIHRSIAGSTPVRGAQISASAFGILHATPVLGRVFDASDEVRGAPDVIILGEDLWASRFLGDPEIIGKTIRVGSEPHTVVGVMPSDFRFPINDQVWLPLRASAVDYSEGEGPQLWVFGRLAEGVTAEAAGAEMRVVTEGLISDRPDLYEYFVGELVDMPILFLGESPFVDQDSEIILMQSAILMLLLIVCGNVGLLTMARTATRSGEISVRTALGASRARIILQVFIEALVLAVVATGFGLLLTEALARWAMGFLERLEVVPYWVDLTLTPGIVFAALVLAAVSAVVAGVLPALRATTRRVQSNLQRTAAGNSTMRFGIGSMVLIVSEIVLSVGFLAMGGTLVRTFFQNTEGLLGFEPERYMAAEFQIPWIDPAEYPEYADEEEFALRVRETQQALLARLVADSEVRGAGLGVPLPGDYFGNGNRIVLEDGSGRPDGKPLYAKEAHVGVDFFRGLRRPILAGRDFATGDIEGEAEAHRPAVIVNSSFVEDVLGGRSPIGQRFRYRTYPEPDPDETEWFEIVGVVGRFGMNPVNPVQDAGVYHPLVPGEYNPVGALVEVVGDPGTFVTRFREIAAAVDLEATVISPMALVDHMESEANLFRWMSLGQVILAGVAFLLSITGLYALMSFTVSQRTREIGIRTALGARVRDIVAMISRRATIQLLVGLALGAAWAWLLLLQVVGDDAMTVRPINIPVTIAVTLACAAAIGVLACASPTVRALRIEPTEALREL